MCIPSYRFRQKKKWSGYEFFGLTKNDVLTHIYESDENKSHDCLKKTRQYYDYSILEEANNVHIRNAGATNQLASKQTQRKI